MPQKCVVDSSLVVKWLNPTNEERVDKADLVLKDAQEDKLILFAPELAKYEIGNTLLVHKKLSKEEAKVTLFNLFTLPIQFVPETEELANATYEIAIEEREEGQITYYDASFVALAKQEDAILVTDNPKHQAIIKEVKVVPLKDYK